MKEVEKDSVHLMITSPPYFNAPFDYKGFYNTYDEFLEVLGDVAAETFRVLAEGRIACVNIDDMLVNGDKFPIVADTTKIFMKAGFRYRDRIVWKKPEGYIRISRRSGVMLQHPYPMYFYPDNLLESILIFQKGKFDYRKVDTERKEASRVDLDEFQKNKWFLSLWQMTNVLPTGKLEKSIAAFPDELPARLIRLFSFVGDTVLDPFLGSGTTMKMARQLDRNSIGYEVNELLLPVIKEKVGILQGRMQEEHDEFEVIIRKEESVMTSSEIQQVSCQMIE
jgi:site-specific DNA-methyltransferase (adenine-specific)